MQMHDLISDVLEMFKKPCFAADTFIRKVFLYKDGQPISCSLACSSY